MPSCAVCAAAIPPGTPPRTAPIGQVRAHAATKEPWWQWTVWLYWAIAWDQREPAAFAESLV